MRGYESTATQQLVKTGAPGSRKRQTPPTFESLLSSTKGFEKNANLKKARRRLGEKSAIEDLQLVPTCLDRPEGRERVLLRRLNYIPTCSGQGGPLQYQGIAARTFGELSKMVLERVQQGK